ncbi:MAG: phosphate acyltransferase PlsX [Planctomycetes bacterium]|nr:phosphate acyltransferase PlsX [Planctomycetota bacterium]
MTDGKIALDAMGGDDAPRAIVRGAVEAVSLEGSLTAERIILVGNQAALESELEDLGGNPGFEIQHASQVVEMAEDPRRAMRGKPDNSISIAAKLVKEGRALGLVSMGNTGMVVAASTLLLGRLEGIRMPAIAVAVGFTGKPMVIVDMGANVDATPENLLHNGLMGSVYASGCLGVEEPRVGLLNVGEEPEKGPQRFKEAHGLLSSSSLGFVGNIEGGDVFSSRADVVITDGFTGNVILKLLEQFSGFLLEKVARSAGAAGVELPREVLGPVMRDLDYAAYGGALLLGVSGTVVIGHGRSDSRAVSNALKQAASAADAAINDEIIAGLSNAGGS